MSIAGSSRVTYDKAMQNMVLGSKHITAGACLAALVVAGCGEDESAGRVDPPVPVAARETGPAQKPGGSQAAAKVVKTGPFEKTFDGIRFSVPAGWTEVENPTPQFVDARFQIPTPHGDVKLTFSSNAGGADVNIERWIGQFQLLPGERRPSVEELSIGRTAAKWVELHGEFVGGAMSGGSTSSGPIERMLGVAIPMGPRDFYLKLTGSDAAVSDVRDAFREFVRTARLTGKKST
jgi:hypothetical protein